MGGIDCSNIFGVHSQVYLQEITTLRLDIKDRDNTLRDKDTELKQLRLNLSNNKKKLNDMTVEYNDLELEYQRLKKVALEDHNKSLKRIRELEQKLANSKNK